MVAAAHDKRSCPAPASSVDALHLTSLINSNMCSEMMPQEWQAPPQSGYLEGFRNTVLLGFEHKASDCLLDPYLTKSCLTSQ